MSRGSGKTQTELLRIIDQREGYIDTFELARAIYYPQEPADKEVLLSISQIANTHRALRGLLKRGKIECGDRGSRGRMRWGKLGSEKRVNESVKNILKEQMVKRFAGGDINAAFAFARMADRMEGADET